MECPTPITLSEGSVNASNARVRRLARTVSSSLVGVVEASRSKCGATTVQPASAKAPRSDACRSGRPPDPTEKRTTREPAAALRTDTSKESRSSCSVCVSIGNGSARARRGWDLGIYRCTGALRKSGLGRTLPHKRLSGSGRLGPVTDQSTPGQPEPMRACGNALQDRCFPTRPDISNIVTSGLPITA